jgi:hypothetical protein
MSTFAVFGMTRCFAEADARKRCPTARTELVDGVSRRVELTPSEWDQACRIWADKLMDGARSVQLCKPFDAPQFAYDYIASCRKTGKCRDLTIKARVAAKDGQGQVIKNKKTGTPKLEWKQWVEPRAA